MTRRENPPTIEQVRSAKAQIVRQFGHHPDFAGAGIGERDGRPAVRVNWRTLPADVQLPDRLGEVEISHHAVGTIRPHDQLTFDFPGSSC